MCSNYFEKLTRQARQLDDGIEKLVTTWQLPRVLIGRFAECTDEANSHIEGVWNAISDTQSGIEEILSSMEKSSFHNSVPINQFIQESRQEYEKLKQMCHDIDGVLAEYGYHYVENDTFEQTNINGNTIYNQTLVKEVENLEVECTLKCKVKQNESTQTQNDVCFSHTFKIPVVNKIASISEDSSISHKNFMSTPMGEHRQAYLFKNDKYIKK